MIYCKEDDDDFILDDIVLSDFDESPDQLQNLINVDCALALSICKTRNLPSCVFVLSLLYMQRLRSLHSSCSLIKIDNLTTEELYIIATLLAEKYLIDDGEDEQLFNSDITELTSIPIERINLIERQVLLALNWNLYVSNDEYKQFQNQMIKRLNKDNDLMRLYLLCAKFLPHTIEYLTLASLILLGSTLSILTAVYIGTLTHSTLMKTFNPTMKCSQSSVCYWNNKTKEMKHFDLEKYRNETTDNNYEFDLPTNVLPSPLSITQPSCSIDINRFPKFSGSVVESIG